MNRRNLTSLLSATMLFGLTTACNAPGELDAGSDAVGSAEQAVSADTSVAVAPSTKELSREWLRWESALPTTTGPVADTTGEKCAMGQGGPVWFLAGSFGGDVTRHCTIPAGKELFFPLINSWLVYLPDYFPNRPSVHAIGSDVLGWYSDQRQQVCSLTLRVDGQDVYAGGFAEMSKDLYVLDPNPYTVYLNLDDNLLTPSGFPGGEMLASDGGHYARLKPLSPGDHVLELGGSQCDGDTVMFETSATYHLHVE